MQEKKIKVRVFRFDPSQDEEPYYQDYMLPITTGSSVFDALDDIHHDFDASLAYYNHAACKLGICSKCKGRVNGKPVLLCQTIIEKDITVEPVSTQRVIRDLVVDKKDGSED